MNEVIRSNIKGHSHGAIFAPKTTTLWHSLHYIFGFLLVQSSQQQRKLNNNSNNNHYNWYNSNIINNNNIQVFRERPHFHSDIYSKDLGWHLQVLCHYQNFSQGYRWVLVKMEHCWVSWDTILTQHPLIPKNLWTLCIQMNNRRF